MEGKRSSKERGGAGKSEEEHGGTKRSREEQGKTEEQGEGEFSFFFFKITVSSPFLSNCEVRFMEKNADRRKVPMD